MTATANFDSPKELLEWAEEAIQEFQTEIDAFFANDPCTMFREVHEEGGYILHKIRLNKPLPKKLARRISEALNWTRLSFDQSTHALLLNCGLVKSNKSVTFPWRESPKDLGLWLIRQGLPEEFWPIFRNTEPYATGEGYAGGDDVIRALAQITGRKKHIARIAVMGDVAGYTHPGVYVPALPGPSSVSITSPAWNPVKNEMTLLKAPIGAQVKNKCELAFHVVFNEDAPLRGHSVTAAANAFLQKSDSFIKALESKLA